ncbi:hypothetical protein BGZ63DRAFT_419729 [Mariannaea sp. PMI_226]|nr:hypothetical protein BGZ63DRAFT_419729 [Mariannaea sp. PMI_226]
MADWSGFMYVSSTPLPVYRRTVRREREKEGQPSDQQQQQPPQHQQPQQQQHHQSPQDSLGARFAFRHTRTNSGSQASQSSHESTSAAAQPPVAGEDKNNSGRGRHQQSQSGDQSSPLSPTASTSPKPFLNFSSAVSASSILNRPGTSDRSRVRDRRGRHADAFSSVDLKNAAMYSPMYPDLEASNKPMGVTTKQINIPFGRTESISSTSGVTTLSTHTMTSTDPSNSPDNPATKSFILRNGRTYYNDATLPYPLPNDLTELHRQCLRTMLLIQVFGGPVTSPWLVANPPRKVLEVGCGTGFWSMMCHQYYKERGHSGISFTGVDIAPLAPESSSAPSDASKPDKEMNWKFVQHDLRQFPWPFPNEEFDLIMVKDLTLSIPLVMYETYMEQYIRMLKPGGTLELWDSDTAVRMLRPHVPNGLNEEAEEHEAALNLGAYLLTPNTPLSAPLNTFLVEYNHWLSKALEARTLTTVPCAIIGPYIFQESEVLMDIRSKRLAIPFSEVRWEREGVGGVVTKDGKSYVEMKGKGPHQKVEKKSLTAGQSALRKTALLTVVQQIQALEPILREASSKSQDEWDLWLGKMMADLMSENGTSWGECLEVGSWSARKRMTG